MFGAIGGFITFIIIAVIILFILSTCIRIVPQAQALVVERLGPISAHTAWAFISWFPSSTVWPRR